MQLRDAVYAAVLASCAFVTQATHLPHAHAHLHRREYGNYTTWTSSAASLTPASTSLHTTIAAEHTSPGVASTPSLLSSSALSGSSTSSSSSSSPPMSNTTSSASTPVATPSATSSNEVHASIGWPSLSSSTTLNPSLTSSVSSSVVSSLVGASATSAWPSTLTAAPTQASSSVSGYEAAAVSSSGAAALSSVMLSSVTFVYTMGTGPSKTVVTITTVITRTFTETSTIYAPTPYAGDGAMPSATYDGAGSISGPSAQPVAADTYIQVMSSTEPTTTLKTSTTTTKTVTVLPASSSGAGGAGATGKAGFQSSAGEAPACAPGTTVTETVRSTITVTASPSTAAHSEVSSMSSWHAPAGTSAPVHAVSSLASSFSATTATTTIVDVDQSTSASSRPRMPPSVSAVSVFGNGTATSATTSRTWGKTGFLTLSSGVAKPSGH